MSVDAVRWAWQARVGKASWKLVLISLADRAGEDHCCYPSIQRLAQDTELDRKTIIAAIQALVELGYVEDTGERRGRTRRVPVYRLVGVLGREEPVGAAGAGQRSQQRDHSHHEPSETPAPERSQDRDHSTVPETEQFQNRNGSVFDQEMVPKTDRKQSQKRYSEPPREPPMEPGCAAARTPAREAEPDDGAYRPRDVDEWQQWFLEQGFAMHQVQRPNVVQGLLEWVREDVTLGDARLCVDYANAKLADGRPASPAYYLRFMPEVIQARREGRGHAFGTAGHAIGTGGLGRVPRTAAERLAVAAERVFSDGAEDDDD